MNTTEALQLYDLEGYLFETVRPRFHAQGWIGAFDFFCIVIWKANRAKSKLARRLIKSTGCNDLETVARDLTSGVYRQPDGYERLRYLIYERGFYLPMASAILTVLYPDEFTVYDTRVCEMLGDFGTIGNTWKPEKLWADYRRYREAVIGATPDGLSLRDRDRYLWALSFARQLEADIQNGFKRGEDKDG